MLKCYSKKQIICFLSTDLQDIPLYKLFSNNEKPASPEEEKYTKELSDLLSAALKNAKMSKNLSALELDNLFDKIQIVI